MLSGPLFSNPAVGHIAGVGGVVALFDASDLATLSISSGAVNAWASRFGTAVAVASGSQRPTWSATARNGTPGVLFDGVSTLLRVINIDNWPRHNNACTIVVSGYLDAGAATLSYAFSYGSTQVRGIRSGGAAPSLRGTLALGSNSAIISSSSIWSGNDRIVTASFAAGKTTKAVFDAQGLSTIGPVLNATTVADYGMIGADVSSANFLKFTCQTIILFLRELADIERQKVEAWCAWRNDPLARGALGASHPYKAAIP